MSKSSGRAPIPTLSWPGKCQPAPVTPQPAQLVEIFEPHSLGATASLAPYNALFLGDNRDVLTYLLAHGYRGQVKLIYIDPPYASGVRWARKVRLRGPKAPTMRTSADHIFAAQAQYTDQWDEPEYLQFMYERLALMRELLAEDGTLWLHCDHRQVHHLRLLLQELFGADNYLNTVVWRSQVARGAKVKAFYFPFSTHYIEIFAKQRSAPPTWHLCKKQLILTEAEAARTFMRDEKGFFRTSDPGTYSFARLKALYAAGRLYAPYQGELIVDETNQQIYASNGGNIGVKYYLNSLGAGKWAAERAIDNFWDDIPGLGTTPGEDLGYPTQKTEALLERVIRTSTDPDDLVLDCFMGSGTTLAVAQRLGRRWLGCDNGWGALLTTRRRLQGMATAEPGAAAAFAVYQLPDHNHAPPRSEPAHARVQVMYNPADTTEIWVEICDYGSPTITAQLAQPGRTPVVAGPPWQALVDCIAIDPLYDGHVFRSRLIDAPRKKQQQVQGRYTLHTSVPTHCVAVRITDVLGEELLSVQQL